jgi:hypothetical protein
VSVKANGKLDARGRTKDAVRRQKRKYFLYWSRETMFGEFLYRTMDYRNYLPQLTALLIPASKLLGSMKRIARGNFAVHFSAENIIVYSAGLRAVDMNHGRDARATWQRDKFEGSSI